MNLTIDWKSKTIDIWGDFGYIRESPYYIGFDRIKTEGQLNDWIKHLSIKVWWDLLLQYQLTEAWKEINKHDKI